MGFNSFSSSLRQYRLEAQRRYELLCEHAEEIGGHPGLVPQCWYSVSHPAYWLDELQRRYWNMAEYEGWEPLPGYDPAAYRRLLAE